MSLIGHAGYQIEISIHVGTGAINCEEYCVQPVLSGALCCLDGQIDSLFIFPLIGVFNQVLTGGNLYNNAFYAAINNFQNILLHATGKCKNLRFTVAVMALSNLNNRLAVLRGDGRHTSLDTMHAHLGHFISKSNLLLFVKNDAGLLLTVPKGHIMKFDLLCEIKVFQCFWGEVPGTGKPLFLVPRCVFHYDVLLYIIYLDFYSEYTKYEIRIWRLNDF